MHPPTSSQWSLPELKSAHKFSIRNAGSMKESTQCGCFYCLAIYDTSLISELDMIEEADGLATVFCPKCGIDAVLNDQCGFTITTEFLTAMSGYFF
jgi:hypothetical protein